jgi:cytochrome c553
MRFGQFFVTLVTEKDAMAASDPRFQPTIDSVAGAIQGARPRPESFTMRKWFKGLLAIVAVLVLAVGGVLAAAWWKTEQMLARHYPVTDPPLAIARDAAAVARGAHLYNAVLGCVECHGTGAVGKLAIDAGPVGRVVAPNLTPPAIGRRYDGDGLAAAIRHGVRPDGTPLRFMPAGDYAHLSDPDTAALVAYLQALPPSANQPGETHFTPLGRTMAMFGMLALTPADQIDHSPRVRAAPVAAVSAEYGAYLAQPCTGCHRADFAGQHVPGTPPDFPDAANLTPHADGLKSWQLADFQRALRTGKRPDGRELAGFMPWRVYSQMTDAEIAAIWAHLSTLPPVASKKKS